MTSDVVIALITIGGALFLAAVGALRDHKEAHRYEDQLDKLRRENQALRHWVRDLLVWGTKSTEDPPRRAPDPPASLEEP